MNKSIDFVFSNNLMIINKVANSGEDAGVQTYIQKIADELVDTMQMCGAHRISEITREMIWTD